MTLTQEIVYQVLQDPIDEPNYLFVTSLGKTIHDSFTFTWKLFVLLDAFDTKILGLFVSVRCLLYSVILPFLGVCEIFCRIRIVYGV
jgi:hypothetical protein